MPLSTKKTTPLRRQLEGGLGLPKPQPVDALKLARQRFLEASRVDMGALADELGINRVTLYRWVGSNELLLGEVLWSLAIDAFKAARQQATGKGADYVSDVIYRFLVLIRGFEPVQHFLAADPEYALRVLTSKHSIVQERVIESFRELLREQVDKRHLKLPQDLETLAYALARLGEAFLYNDLITGREPDLKKAKLLIRALLSAPWDRL